MLKFLELRQNRWVNGRTNMTIIKQGCRKRGGGGGATSFFGHQLTLSQPGGHIMPTTVLQAPLDFQTLRRDSPVKYIKNGLKDDNHLCVKLTAFRGIQKDFLV